MQYPELNIGEFASRHSANVELENHENEEGYFLMVDVESWKGEEGYSVSIGARPKTAEEVGKLYENQFEDFPSDELTTVYGNDEEAIQSMRGSNVWARFEAPTEKDKEDSYDLKGWAVDIAPLIREMKSGQYQKVMDEISASTLYVINRAESEGEVGTGLEDFHRDIIREFRPAENGPVVIDVVEGSERDSEYVELDEGDSGAETSRDEFIEEPSDSVVSPEPGVTERSDDLERPEAETQFEYDKIVSGTISESKSRIEEIKDELGEEDWEALLEAEREGDDRVTFKPYLEERLEAEREDT